MIQTLSGQSAVDVLASPDYDVVPYGARYAALAERLGLDFAAIGFALAGIPLSLNGEAHRRQRAEVARLIAERKPLLTAALPELVEASFQCLTEPGRHELMTCAIVPVVDRLIGMMAGIDLELGANSLVSRIFSQKMGVAQRQRLNGELTELIERLRQSYPTDSDERAGARIALVVLGRDAMLGTVALSLKHYFETQTEALVLPPSHTGVPYIDRKSQATGEVYRCLLLSLQGQGDTDRQRFFGAGAHVCLGRMAALEVFAQLAGLLARIRPVVTVESCVMRDCDVFAIPEHLWIRVN